MPGRTCEIYLWDQIPTKHVRGSGIRVRGKIIKREFSELHNIKEPTYLLEWCKLASGTQEYLEKLERRSRAKWERFKKQDTMFKARAEKLRLEAMALRALAIDEHV